MTHISKELEDLLASNKRKKISVLITTDSDFKPEFSHKKIMDGILTAKIGYKQLMTLKKEEAIQAVELDDEMDAI